MFATYRFFVCQQALALERAVLLEVDNGGAVEVRERLENKKEGVEVFHRQRNCRLCW